MKRNFRLERARLELDLAVAQEEDARDCYERIKNLTVIPESAIKVARMELVEKEYAKKIAQLAVDELLTEC